MEKERAPRNRTLVLSDEECLAYGRRCLDIGGEAALDSILDRTINADTLKVLALLPRAFVDLMVVDPPYNLDKDFNASSFRKMSHGGYRDYVESWFSGLLPLLKADASIYVCCDWRSSSAVFQVLDEHVTVRNRISWQREKGRGASSNWKNCVEDIWFATVGKEYCFNVEAVMMKRRVLAPYREGGVPKDWVDGADGRYRMTYPSNFWDDLSIPYWSMPENTDHPTQKPEKLLAKLVLASSRVGSVVFDPFLGSGTTSVVAKKLGRKYVGIEIDPLYCAWAEKRLADADLRKDIQGYADGVFWERNTSSQQKSGRKGTC